MFGLGPTELIVILAIVVLLFGSTKLPTLARSLGQARNEFEAGAKERIDEDGKTESAKKREA